MARSKNATQYRVFMVTEWAEDGSPTEAEDLGVHEIEYKDGTMEESIAEVLNAEGPFEEEIDPSDLKLTFNGWVVTVEGKHSAEDIEDFSPTAVLIEAVKGME